MIGFAKSRSWAFLSLNSVSSNNSVWLACHYNCLKRTRLFGVVNCENPTSSDGEDRGKRWRRGALLSMPIYALTAPTIATNLWGFVLEMLFQVVLYTAGPSSAG